MTSTHAPIHESIDSMIHWLRGQRIQQPNTPLPQLINLAKMPIDRVTDIACIDLIERKRLGHSVHVEDFLRDIPALRNHSSALLDLVDAEICVQNELGQAIDIRDYTNRFPEHVSEIAELLRLNAGTPILEPSDHSSVISSLPADNDCVLNAPVLLSVPAKGAPISGVLSNDAGALDHAIHPPPWFTREQLHSSTSQSCLIRGRDSNENRAVALKIIRLTDGSKQTADAVLAEVEAASAVRHPAWVQPDVAAIESQRLAVIRPWIFGHRWDIARRHASVETRLHDLARVGYALQSAHDTKTRQGHATHGGLHLSNLIVDAEGQIRIIDAATCVQPAAGEMYASLSGREPQGDAKNPCAKRRLSDIQSLCMLIRLATSSAQKTDPDFHRGAAALDRICQNLIAESLPTDVCARIADATLKLANGNLKEDVSPGLASKAKAIWNRIRHPSI